MLFYFSAQVIQASGCKRGQQNGLQGVPERSPPRRNHSLSWHGERMLRRDGQRQDRVPQLGGVHSCFTGRLEARVPQLGGVHSRFTGRLEARVPQLGGVHSRFTGRLEARVPQLGGVHSLGLAAWPGPPPPPLKANPGYGPETVQGLYKFRRHNYIYLLKFKVLMEPIILVFIKLMGAAISGHCRRGSRIFEKGGGVQARIQDCSQAPPLDIVRVTSSALRKFEKHPPPCARVTSSALRKFEKHPHSWTFTSTPLGHCPCDVIHIPRGGGDHPCHTHTPWGGGLH